jgi:hypothetical protein
MYQAMRSLLRSQGCLWLALLTARCAANDLTYTGDAACAPCHQSEFAAYHQTAHYLTSQWPTKDSVHGKFSAGKNIFLTGDTNLIFEMTANEAGFFQKAVRTVSPTRIGHRQERLDLVIGSGRKGQTYTFWKSNLLYQLPVSYWTALDAWVNSPGYPDGVANFERPVTPRCLECHATTFKSLAPPTNRYAPTSLVLGITCEKCHGPGGEHAAKFRSPTPPKLRADFAILNPATFVRARQMDACGFCHAGGGKPIAPALTFVPGEEVDKFLEFPKSDLKTTVDVHGSSVQLLEKSRCFQSSQTMTCSTCHNVHGPQRDLATFATKCLTCHQVEKCGEFARLGHQLDTQCVVCHMPLQTTSLIVSTVNGKSVRPEVRNHQIGIYPEVKLP